MTMVSPRAFCHMPSQLLMSHSTISASSSWRKVFRWMVSPLPSPVWQQHAVVAQEEVVEKTVEEDHRPTARLGQFEFSAPAESPASAVGVKALRTVKV